MYRVSNCIWSRCNLSYELRNDQTLDLWNTTSLKSLSAFFWLDPWILQGHLPCVPGRNRRYTFNMWHLVEVFWNFLFSNWWSVFPASVTGFLLTHCRNTSTGFGKPNCCQYLSSLTKSDHIWCNSSSMFLKYPWLVLSFSVVSSNCRCVVSFS